MKCFDIHKKCGVSCDEKDCRQWIDYEDDLNCTIIAVNNNNEAPMTLREVGDRVGVSFVRIKQIEDKILGKLTKRKYIDK